MNYKSLAIQMASSLNEIDRLNAEFNSLLLSGMDTTDCFNRIKEVNISLTQTKNQVFKLTQEELTNEN